MLRQTEAEKIIYGRINELEMMKKNILEKVGQGKLPHESLWSVDDLLIINKRIIGSVPPSCRLHGLHATKYTEICKRKYTRKNYV